MKSSRSSLHSFRHRHNDNDTWDSICLRCYLTVTTAVREDGLEAAEQCHDCAELMAARTATYEDEPVLKSPTPSRHPGSQSVDVRQ